LVEPSKATDVAFDGSGQEEEETGGRKRSARKDVPDRISTYGRLNHPSRSDPEPVEIRSGME